MIIKRNDIKNPVYIGNTQGDFDTIKLNRVPFVYVDYGFVLVEGVDYVISSISELLKIDF